jgi:hypothetical protein
MKKKTLKKISHSHRGIRNLGIFFTFTGFIGIIFSSGYYIFGGSSFDLFHLDLNDAMRHIVALWIPIIGGVIFVSGILMISRYEYIEELDS